MYVNNHLAIERHFLLQISSDSAIVMMFYTMKCPTNSEPYCDTQGVNWLIPPLTVQEKAQGLQHQGGRVFCCFDEKLSTEWFYALMQIGQLVFLGKKVEHAYVLTYYKYC